MTSAGLGPAQGRGSAGGGLLESLQKVDLRTEIGQFIGRVEHRDRGPKASPRGAVCCPGIGTEAGRADPRIEAERCQVAAKIFQMAAQP